jgi:hypothetical protein
VAQTRNDGSDARFANRMSDAGDEIQVEAPEVEVTAEPAAKGKLTVEDALQVGFCVVRSPVPLNQTIFTASTEKCPCPRWSRSWSP